MVPSLDPTLCRVRQDRLRGLLAERGLDAAVFTNRHYVHALTGYWHAHSLTSVAVLVPVDDRATLVSPAGSLPAPAVGEHVHYVAQKLATIVENVDANMYAVLHPLLHDFTSVGFHSQPLRPFDAQWVDITSAYQYLRRKKDPDELALLRYAVAATETVFAWVKEHLSGRPTEVELHAEMYATALREVGEPLSGWGNDFQSGSPGGLPRPRRVVRGELAVYDLGIGVRGYRSDLCRTFVVEATPTSPQKEAQARIVETLEHVETLLQPDLSCRELYYEIHDMLDGWNGCVFPHHLGHGIGLDAHEVPRLNPEWDDTLQVGDVIAIEPALYATELRSGIRLEQNYLITESGAERLSVFPLDL